MKSNLRTSQWLALLALATNLNAAPSNLGANWTSATNAAAWSARTAPGAVAFSGQLWVFGGCYWNGAWYGTNDVWSSSDGATWTCATNAAPWGARWAFGAASLASQMWVLGGASRSGDHNDVWSSSDGITWTCVTNAAPWGGRNWFEVVAFNGQLWVLGGGLRNDVWSSSDGTTWTRATNAAAWSGRSGLGAVALNGQLWVLGGNTSSGLTNDVWCSSDGMTWSCVTNAAPWCGRQSFSAVALDGQMWIFGGGDASGFCHSDVWSSSDGMNWTCVTNPAPWSGNVGVGAVALNGQLWKLGGGNNNSNYGYGTSFNDVWFSQNTLGPVLNIAPIGNQSALFWPGWATNYLLESSTNLSSTNWATVTNGVPIIGITLTNTSPEQLFRLRQF